MAMKTKAKKSSGGTRESFVVQSKVKQLIKKAKMKCASDVVTGLNQVIAHHVDKAVNRAKANGRKTLRGSDL